MKRIQSEFIAQLLIVSFIVAPLTPLFAEENIQTSETQTTQNQQLEMVNESLTNTQTNQDTSTDAESQDQINSDQEGVENTVGNKNGGQVSNMEELPKGPNEPNIVLTPLNISHVSKAPLPNTDNNTGALTYEYPIAVPPGINGLTPSVSLKYNSQKLENSNILGHGWEITLPYIVRKNTHGVDQLYSTNNFTSSEDGDLSLINTTGSTLSFSPQSQTSNFNKYTLDTSTNTWTLVTKTGTTFIFGDSVNNREDDPSNPAHVFKWMISTITDTNNNIIKYTYTKNQNKIYPLNINYSIFDISFRTETRQDFSVANNAGFSQGFGSRIKTILTKVSGVTNRTYTLSYGVGDNGIRSVLSSISDGALTTSYTYSHATPWWTDAGNIGVGNYPTGYLADGGSLPSPNPQVPYFNFIDVNGDAYSDIIYGYNDRTAIASKTFIHSGKPIEQAAGSSFYTYFTNPYLLTPSMSLPNNGVLVSVENHGWGGFKNYPQGYLFGDLNGDALVDIQRNIKAYSWDMYSYPGDISSYLNTQGASWNTNQSTWNTTLPIEDPELNVSSYKSQHANMLDLNGDGLSDLLGDSLGIVKWQRNNGAGFNQPQEINLPAVPSDFGCGSNPTDDYLDLNADGLIDYLHVAGQHGSCSANSSTYADSTAYLNTGNLTWTQNSQFKSPMVHPGNVFAPAKKFFYIDINGDGLVDIVPDSVTTPNQLSSFIPENFLTFLNTGNGWIPSHKWDIPMLGMYGMEILEMNGDGLPDFTYSSYPAFAFVLSRGTVSDLLSSVTTSSGAKTDVTYKPSAQYRNLDNSLANPKLPFIIQTVNTITTNDGNGTTATDTFSYENGSYYYKNPTDRKFAGFEKVTQTKPDGSKSVSYFHQGNDANATSGETNDHVGKIGKVYREDVTDAQNNIFKRTWYSWDSADSPSDSSYTYLTSTLEQLYGPNASHTDKATTTTYNMQNGNVESITEWGDVQSTPTAGAFTDIGNDKRVTNISYASNPSEIIFAPSEIVKTDQSGNVFEKSRLYYDNLPLHTLSKGNNTKTEKFKNASQFITTKKTFNQKGLVTTEEDGKGNVTHYTYDAHGLYPQTITNPLLQDTVYTYDYASGKPLSITTPNATFTTEYDGFGRVTKENIPNENGTLVTKTQYLYTDTPNNVAIKKIEHLTPANAVESYTYLDGQGREIQSKREAEGGNWITTDTLYDSSSRIAKKSLPYFTQSSTKSSPTTNENLYSIFSYDPLNRMLTQTRATGSLGISYDLSKKTVIDEAGKIKVFTTDAFNNLVQVTEVNNGTEYNTLYEYDPQNSLKKISDANGNVRNFTYDLLGRRLSAEDIHATSDTNFGVYTFTYDNNGNVISKVTPKGQTISYTYDPLNRIAAEDLGPTPGVEVVYLYDNCLNGIGKLCEVYGMDIAKTEFAYKKDGQIAKEMKYLSGDIFTTHYTKDYQGNVVSITNPNQASIQYTYNNAGLVDAVAYVHGEDTKVVVSNVEYAPTGVPTLQVNGNGTQTCNVYDADKLYRLIIRKTVVGTNCDGVTNPPTPSPNPTEEPPIPGTDPIPSVPPPGTDPIGGETQSMPGEGTPSDGTPTPTPTSVTILPSPLVQPLIQSLAYTYDPVGNILSIVDSVKGTTKAYTYDDLHRLTTVANPAVPGLEEVFFYDPIGNIALYNNIPYTYQTSGKTNPHAATQVGAHTLTYDANGNLLTDGALTNTWNYNNTLRSTTKGGITTSSLYDHTGSRVEKSTDSLTTLYPSTYFIQEGTDTTSLVTLNNQNIATIKEGQAVFNHTDHLGSTTVSTNDQGSIVEQTVYASFGEETHRATFNTTQLRKYIGEMYDGETDLNYLNARYYNGTHGQFISQDPVFWEVGQSENGKKVLMDPQIQNSYSYGANNPISKKDATGRIPVDTIADAGFILYDLASLGYNLYKGNTEAAQVDRQALGLDITGAALPYATGLGAAMRVGKGVDVVRNVDKAKEGISTLNVADLNKNVRDSFEFLEVKNWNVNRPGVANGREFKNKDGILPGNTKYKEFDVNSTNVKPNRDTERFVRGNDGKTYYTNDHYKSFVEIKK